MKKPTRSERVQAVLDWQLWGPVHAAPEWWRDDITDPEAVALRRKLLAQRYSTAERPMMFLEGRG